MRSQLVSDAIRYNPNRYLLSRVVAQATRGLHRPSTRMEDTLNHAFRLLSPRPTAEVTVDSPPRLATDELGSLLCADCSSGMHAPSA